MDISICQASVILRGLPLQIFSIGRYGGEDHIKLCYSLIEDSDTYI